MKLRDQIPLPDRLKQGADILVNIVTLPYQILPAFLSIVFFAVRGKMGCRFLSPNEVPSRPSRKTLLPALLAFARAKIESPEKMRAALFDPGEMNLLAPIISVMRELADISLGFHQIVYGNLSLIENQGHSVLLDYYPLIREYALADEELRRLLAPVEEHLYGAAKEAADTNKEHARLRKESEEKGHKAGVAAALADARAEVSSQIKGLAESLLNAASKAK
jgi:hypothetical protein